LQRDHEALSDPPLQQGEVRTIKDAARRVVQPGQFRFPLVTAASINFLLQTQNW